MIVVLASMALVVWIVFAVFMTLNLLLIRKLANVRETCVDHPLVSIVVPARNEARGIEKAVRSFCQQDYPNLEVVVVDDRSSDETPAILKRLAAEYSRLRLIEGVDPPAGWLGKPNALEQGRLNAKGDWLLFVDADVVYDPSIVRRAVAYVTQNEQAMLTLMPNFQTGSWLEATLMSNLYLITFAMCPLFLINHSRNRLFAAGGGVFNLVRRDALEQSDAFSCLKDAVVDDIGLGYKVKAAGFPLKVLRADNLITIRMYFGVTETINGFTKNVYPAMRNAPIFALMPFVFGSWLILLPYFALARELFRGSWSIPAVLTLAAMHGVTLVVSFCFRQPLIVAFMNPIREIGWWYILIRSMLAYYRRGIHWRGRTFESDKIKQQWGKRRD